MSDSAAFVALAVAFGGLLFWGLKSGEMPAKMVTVRRKENPILFWIWGMLLATFAVLSAAAAMDAWSWQLTTQNSRRS